MRLAHVAVDDTMTRARITDTLRRYGWTVREQPTGFHLLAAIADIIDDNARAAPDVPTDLPGLLVVDAIARGCAGLTIATGLRELGARIPLLLITRPGMNVPVSDDPLVRVASPDAAVRALTELSSCSYPATRTGCGSRRSASSGRMAPAGSRRYLRGRDGSSS